MKVAYSLTQCAHTVPGGTAVSALELRRALIDGPDPLEIVSVGAQRGRRPAPLDVPEPAVSYPIPYPLLYDLWNRTEKGGVDRLVPDANVIHITMGFCPVRRRIPQVSTIHDMFPFSHPELFTARGTKVMTAGLRRVFERADLIATPSQASANEIVSRSGVSAARIRVVPWGATPQVFTEDQLADVQRRLRLPDEFVLFAGTLEPRKNLDVLLRALDAAGNNSHLVMVGPAGWGDIGDRIARSASERLHVLGSLDRQDLLATMTLARALCMPSIDEGFGLPALEAMAQGTPVLHSEAEALREVVGDTGQTMSWDDDDAWASAMADMCNDASRSEELGGRARERSLQLTWESSARQMRAVYEELA